MVEQEQVERRRIKDKKDNGKRRKEDYNKHNFYSIHVATVFLRIKFDSTYRAFDCYRTLS